MMDAACTLALTLLTEHEKCPACGWPASDHREWPHARVAPAHELEDLRAARRCLDRAIAALEAKERAR